MTIEEAIRVLQNSTVRGFTIPPRIRMEATLLGIEALKWIYALRGIVKSLPPDKLPGETKSPS